MVRFVDVDVVDIDIVDSVDVVEYTFLHFSDTRRKSCLIVLRSLKLISLVV